MATRRRGSYAHNFCGNFNNLGEATINSEKEKFFPLSKKHKMSISLKGGLPLAWTKKKDPDEFCVQWKKDSDSRKGKHGLTSC